jgi:general secretion pathway protein G
MKSIITLILLFLIMCLISFGVMGHVMGGGDKSKQDKDTLKQRMNIIKSAIDAYYLNTGQYPKTFDELIICPTEYKKVWAGPYVSPSMLNDPWGNRYIYEPNSSNPANYNIITYGADGKLGGKRENRDISILMDIRELSKIEKAEREEAEIEAKKQKELTIKTSIIVGWFLSSIGTIAIYKYKNKVESHA